MRSNQNLISSGSLKILKSPTSLQSKDKENMTLAGSPLFKIFGSLKTSESKEIGNMLSAESSQVKEVLNNYFNSILIIITSSQ